MGKKEPNWPPCFLAGVGFITVNTKDNFEIDATGGSECPRVTNVMSKFQITQLAIPSVTVLITFLSYSSQYLFLYLEPEPLEKWQLIKFNTLLVCLWICYIRACITDPGHVPKHWKPQVPGSGWKRKIPTKAENEEAIRRQRWCRRCEALKPPRAHHCRTCRK